MIYGGMVVHPIDTAKDVARAWRDWVEDGPDEVATALGVLLAPPEPFVPPEVQGKPVMGILAMYVGTADEGEEALRPLKTEIGPPAVDLLDRIPYTAFQAIVDPFSPTGWLNYHGGKHLTGMPDAAIDAYIDEGRKVASPMSQAILFRTGGAIARVPEDATAASHRDAPYMWHPIAAWSDPAENDDHIGWVREYYAAMEPYATGGVYLNFEQDEGADHVRAGFSPEKYARLVELKDKYDPNNLFQVNQNIAPSGAAR
jgi:hypothetical protein